MSDALRAESASAEALMGEIVDAFLERLGRGERPEVEDYARRYPQLATVLRQMLPALQAVHGSAAELPRPAGFPAPEIEPEAPLGDFRIVRETGRGGMGVVYEAVQVSLGRRVALKVLPFAAALDARQLRRFQNEAHAAAQLHHTNIVPVYAVGQERGVHYYAMQFIEGQTVAALIQDLRRLAGQEPKGPARPVTSGHPGPFPNGVPAADTVPQPAAVSTARPATDPTFFRTAARLAVQAALALEHAHRLGVVHRDVKPANLLVDGQGNLWVTDFGLAQVQTRDARLTLTGDLVGTLRYMSPEQALAQPAGVDQRTDIYALGATLYELLTLEPAFNGRDRQELLRQIAFEEPRPPRRVNKAVPAELETIVLKAMARSPAERYATAQELANDLERFLKDEPIRARRPSLVQRWRKWARRHRPVVWSAAALFATLAVLAGSVGWVLRDRADRQARTRAAVRDALEEAQRFHEQAHWAQAQAAVQRAEALLPEGTADPALAARVRALLRELAAEDADRRLLAGLEEIRLRQAGVNVRENRFALEEAVPEYGRVFKAYGLLAGAVPPAKAAARIRGRPRTVRNTLLAALDHWLILARYKKAPEAPWLEQVLAAADTDAWRQSVRAARARNDRPALERLAREVDVRVQPAEELFLLGMSLKQRGARESALALLRRGQEAFPGDFWMNHNLGWALYHCRPPRLEEAVRYLTAALALKPDSPPAHLNLGSALWKHGRHEEALAAFRKAVALKRDYAEAHGHLGDALLARGRLDEAVAAFRKAVALKPAYAEAHCDLGFALRQQGEFAQALAATKRGHELGSRRQHWSYPSARWVRQCRRLNELAGRLPAVLRGESQPADAAERVEYAQVCSCRKLYAAAARLWAEAFADPKLAEPLKAAHRYNAACAAARAGCGQGKDAGTLDAPGRARWRRQALDWLRAELAVRTRQLESGRPSDRAVVRLLLRHWQRDPDLAGLRDPDAVAELPTGERGACRRLWAEVKALLDTADSAR
jgi:serine/threonine protein kinase/Flp pilus assembly protein TadD